MTLVWFRYESLEVENVTPGKLGSQAFSLVSNACENATVKKGRGRMSQRNPYHTPIPARASAVRDTTTNAPAVQKKKRVREAEDTIGGTLQPLSTVRHRPISTTSMFVVPMNDGTLMRVTERELADLPLDWQQYARPIATPQRQHLPHPVQAEPEQHTEDFPRQRREVRFHWFVFVGIALFVMIVGWSAISAFNSWWQIQQDDWHYGRPRTYQTDCNVGHGTAQNPMSHFIAINLNRHIEVIEIPGNDPSKSKIYIGPMLIGQGQDLTPVTLTFSDVNGDGKVDMVIHVLDSTFIFLNTGTEFKPAPNQQQ